MHKHNPIQPQIPSLGKMPLLGNVFEFQSDRLGLFSRLYNELGDIGIFYAANRQVIMVNSSEYAQDVLITHDSHMGKIPFLKIYLDPLLGNGLLNAENRINRVHKKLMAPAFHRQAIAKHSQNIVDAIQGLMATWSAGSIIDVHDAMMQITLIVITQALFGADVSAAATQIGEDFLTVSRHVTSQTTAALPLPLSWPTPANRRFWAAMTRMNTTIQHIIDARRQSPGDYQDLLAMLMNARYDDGTTLSDQQIRDEVMTLFFAGHDTTGNGLSWTWHLLMTHPSILQRVQTEVDQQLRGRSPQIDDLTSLPYTLQVFKEALRLYPPVYIIPRYVVESFHLGPYFVPAGSSVGISPYVLHRRADYFPNPTIFDPDRFTAEAEAQRPRGAYIPFAAGPRMCIGASFALMEAHLILAVMASRLTLTPTSQAPVVPEPLITLRPKEPLLVRVEQRTPHTTALEVVS